jgi:hypothetical protein
MKHLFLASSLLLSGLLTSCHDKGPGPMPPQLYGSTWDLSSSTIVLTDPTGTTTTNTSTVPSGTYSITYPGDGTYRLTTGGATATGGCVYDGSTITLSTTVGASPNRVMTVSALTTAQLVTVEKTQAAGSSYTTTSTYTRL